MPSVNVSQEDFEFLQAQAEKDGVSVEEYVGFMVDRQRVIVKHQASPTDKSIETKATNLEAPHRKWGM